MKETYNAAQRAYMLAKANHKTMKNIHDDFEREFIIKKGITNKDGTTPDLIYCVDDDDLFDELNSEFDNIPEAKKNWQNLIEAEKLLEIAEEELIKYGLSIVPENICSILAKGAKNNPTIRTQLIDLVFKLDVSTVKA